MKKTIITAALCLGLTSGAMADSALDDAITLTDLTAGGHQTFTQDSSKDYAYSTQDGNYQQFTMTAVFDSKTLLSTLATASNGSGKAVELAIGEAGSRLGIGFNVTTTDDGVKTLQAVAQAGQSSHTVIPTIDLTDLLNSNDTIVLTMTTGSAGTSLYLYNPETETVSTSGTQGGYHYSSTTAYDHVWVDNAWGGAVNSIYLFDTIQTPNEILAISKAAATVPEPTTATLSLLALAGLAARRRRK